MIYRLFLLNCSLPVHTEKKNTSLRILTKFLLAKTKSNKEDIKNKFKKSPWVFPGGAVVESLPANAGDTGSSPGLGRSHMLWSN